MVPPKLRLIGDGHGNLEPIRQALTEGHAVVHLGFADAWKEVAHLPDVFVVAGNHDDYGVAPQTPNYLGDFGDLGSRIAGCQGIWFVRGAWSIDRRWRVEGEDWWPQEELEEGRATEALEAYRAAKPHTVLSHDCPLSVARMLYPEARSTRTGEMLQAMLDAHAPARWYFGHWHVRWSSQIGSTTFRALAIDEILNLEQVRNEP